MHRSRFNSGMTLARGQRGAALVIGLLLLVILTLLAISGMNTASTELVMAGNEQYRQKAFNAAGSGVEDAIEKLPSVVSEKGVAVLKDTPASSGKIDVVEGDANEAYETTTQYLGDDYNVLGYSTGKFFALHFEVVSTGTAPRGATSVQRQGVFLVGGPGDKPEVSIVTDPPTP